MCIEISLAALAHHCLTSPDLIYYSNTSETFTKIDREWRGEFAGTGKMFGEYGEEFVSLNDDKDESIVNVTDFRFVRGLLMDFRYACLETNYINGK